MCVGLFDGNGTMRHGIRVATRHAGRETVRFRVILGHAPVNDLSETRDESEASRLWANRL